MDHNPQYRINSHGWINGHGRIQQSPNCDSRPEGCEIAAVIVHAISLPAQHYGGNEIDELFLNTLDCDCHEDFETLKGLAVSSHFLIRRTGALVQFVSTEQRAWHAGVSVCMGRERVNDFSIGVELEGCDEESFTLAQYRELAALAKVIRWRYPGVSKHNFFGHADIAPGRKTDPGPYFDWKRFTKLLN